MHDKMISKALLRIFRHGDNEPDDGGKRDCGIYKKKRLPKIWRMGILLVIKSPI